MSGLLGRRRVQVARASAPCRSWGVGELMYCASSTLQSCRFTAACIGVAALSIPPRFLFLSHMYADATAGAWSGGEFVLKRICTLFGVWSAKCSFSWNSKIFVTSRKTS